MRKFVHRNLVVAFVLLAGLFSGSAYAAEGVRETILPNGLRVLTKEAHAAPVLTVQVWYRVGSRNEHTGMTGYSHLLEHMMFKGTKTFKKGELTRQIRKLGGIDNAGTWTDFTEYWELLSSDHLEFALKAEADRMVNSLIDPKELKSEMVVVRSELEGRENSPDTLLWDAVTATAFTVHSYQWPVIGWRSDVEGVNRNALYSYYKTYYHPNNATLIIVGDFDTARALALARKYFGKLPPGPVPPPVRTVEPTQHGERTVRVERPGSTERTLIAYHIPAITSRDTYPLIVLDQILSGGKSSRFYQALVQTELATESYSSISPRRDPSLFYLAATARSGVTGQKVEMALLDQVEAVQSTMVSDEELTRAKNQLEADFIFSHDSVSRQAEDLGYYSTVANWKIVDQYIPKIRQVTAADVMRVAQDYLTEPNRTIGWFIPVEETVPRKPSPAKSSSAATPARGKPATSARVAAKATKPAKPAVHAAAAAGIKPFRTVLANGMVVIVQENHSNPTVAIRGNLKAGSVFDPQGKQGLASITAGMLSRGTESRTSLQLAKESESVGATANISGGTEAVTFSGSSLKKDFRTVVEILSDMLRNPSFPADELEKLRGQTISGLEQQKESPDQRADRLFRATVFPPGHPYHQQTIEEDEQDLKSIARDDLVDFYKSYYSPATAIIVIAGDVNRQTAVKAVGDYFGTWQAKGPPAAVKIPSVSLQAAPVRKVIPMPDKSEVDVLFGHAGMLARNNPDFYAAMVMNQILGGGGALSSRLGRSIRENKGLVYDVYSTFEPTLGEGPWYISLGTNPANADKAIAAMKAEVVRMRDKGATATEVREAIEFITGFFPIRLEQNSGVATTLLNAEFYGLGMNYIRDYAKLYRAVALKQVNAAAKKYLHPERATLVIAGTYK